MNTTRFIAGLVAAMLLTGLAAGCRKRKPAGVPTTESQPPTQATETSIPAQAPPPVSLPTGAGTALAPSNAGDPGKEAVKTQDRFNRNTAWISKLSSNNPQLRAQVLAEIQKAGLSPVELQELRKQAQMYGVKL